MIKDKFRPRSEPARSIYDAYVKRRETANPCFWDCDILWHVVVDWCEDNNKPEPDNLYSRLRKISSQACGHTDFEAKLARGVADMLMEGSNEKNES